MLRNININDLASLFLYIIIFAYSIFLYNKYSKERNVIFLIFSILIVALLATFRKSGTDYYNYEHIYESISKLDVSEFFSYYIELGWRFINYISPNYYFVLFISSFIFLSFSAASINYFVKKYKLVSWIILLLVFYGVFINIMRQMLAVSIFSYACVQLFKNKNLGAKLLLYIFWIIIAAMFHKSALLMLIVPLFYFIKNKRTALLLVLIVCPLIPVLSVLIFGILRYLNIYNSYIGNDMDLDISFILCMLPPFALMLLYLFNIGSFKKDSKLSTLICLYSLCFPIQVLGFMAKNVDRLTYYFYFMMIFIIPMIISQEKKRLNKSSIKNLSLVWYSFYFLAVFFVVNLTDMFPYR